MPCDTRCTVRTTVRARTVLEVLYVCTSTDSTRMNRHSSTYMHSFEDYKSPRLSPPLSKMRMYPPSTHTHTHSLSFLPSNPSYEIHTHARTYVRTVYRYRIWVQRAVSTSVQNGLWTLSSVEENCRCWSRQQSSGGTHRYVEATQIYHFTFVRYAFIRSNSRQFTCCSAVMLRMRSCDVCQLVTHKQW